MAGGEPVGRAAPGMALRSSSPTPRGEEGRGWRAAAGRHAPDASRGRTGTPYIRRPPECSAPFSVRCIEVDSDLASRVATSAVGGGRDRLHVRRAPPPVSAGAARRRPILDIRVEESCSPSRRESRGLRLESLILEEDSESNLGKLPIICVRTVRTSPLRWARSAPMVHTVAIDSWTVKSDDIHPERQGPPMRGERPSRTLLMPNEFVFDDTDEQSLSTQMGETRRLSSEAKFSRAVRPPSSPVEKP
jgi:hypothetical protein